MATDTNATTVTPSAQHFERAYLDVRQKERRIYTDDEVAVLPQVPTRHPHHSEWQIRKRSADGLITHLSVKHRALRILEVGCGNGWLSSKLANVPDAVVTGTDINTHELEQANRVFGHRANLAFGYGDIRSLEPAEKFDVIVFAASIQYFGSFENAIEAASRLLATNGEIHITDTVFYAKSDVCAARQRSEDYYKQMGATGMETMYFHHTLDDVKQYRHKKMYDPRSLGNRLLRRTYPFHWFIIYP